jgi:hypothetical protein
MKLKLNKTARDWLREEDACSEGFAWAERSCETLREVVATARPDWALWVLFRPGVLTDRELWLIACHVAEMALPVWYAWAPDDHRPRTAIETRRRWLDGLASDEELSAACSAACSAAESACSAAESACSAARLAAESAWLPAECSDQVKWTLENCSTVYVDDAR